MDLGDDVGGSPRDGRMSGASLERGHHGRLVLLVSRVWGRLALLGWRPNSVSAALIFRVREPLRSHGDK